MDKITVALPTYCFIDINVLRLLYVCLDRVLPLEQLNFIKRIVH